MLPYLLSAAIVIGIPTIYVAAKYREFRKFLAGAFFVSSGVQFDFWLTNLTVPLVGTDVVQTPEVSGTRSIIHFVLFLVCLYFGFIRGRVSSGANKEGKEVGGVFAPSPIDRKEESRVGMTTC
jgi:Kef-type K+ transport system membrane component KefB